MAKGFQPALTGGELTPSLHSRIDLAKYQSGLALAKNWFIHSQGGISTRAGFAFTGYVADSTRAHRLIPFKFNTEQAYALLFGHLTMRVVRNGALVLDAVTFTITGITQAADAEVTTSGAHGLTSGDRVYLSAIAGMTELNGRWVVATVTAATTFTTGIDSQAYTAYSSAGTVSEAYEIATPFDESDLFLLKHTQDADIMTITHRDYNIQELSRTGHNAWAITNKPVAVAVEFPIAKAITAAIGSPAGSYSKQYRYAITAVVGGIESRRSDTASSLIVGVLTHTTTGVSNSLPAVFTVSGAAPANDTVFWANPSVGMEEIGSILVKVKNSSGSTFEAWHNEIDEPIDSTGFGAWSSGANLYVYTENGAPSLSSTYGLTLNWVPVAAVDYYNVYKEDTPYSGIFGWIGEADADKTSFRDYNTGPDMSYTPPLKTNPFESASDYPICCEYHQQRLVFGGSINNPEAVNGSRTAQYDNFDVSRPLRADDALAFSLKAREVNEVRHLVSLDDLIILTSGSEVRVQGDQSGTLKPDAIVPRVQGYRGVSHVKPLVVGDSVLFVQERGSRIRDLAYTYDADKYTGNDLAIMSEHFFYGYEIIDWAYSQEPYSVVWVVRDDGTLLSMTYLKEHQIWGWTQHETNGVVESVCSIPESSGEDVVYAVIKRNIDGVDRRQVERMSERRFTDIEDAFCVDGGSTYQSSSTSVQGIALTDPVVVTTTSAHGLLDGDKMRLRDVIDDDSTLGQLSVERMNMRYFTVANKTATTFELLNEDGTDITSLSFSGGIVEYATDTIRGLDHLESETVTSLIDGNVASGLTVSNGQVMLPSPCTTAHIGLPYVCSIKTLPVNFQKENVHGRKKGIREVALRVRDTRGLSVGPSLDKMVEIKDRNPQMSYGRIDAITGEQRVTIKPAWSDFGDFFVQQTFPLPATILALVPEIEVG